jgi:hypothetical protein
MTRLNKKSIRLLKLRKQPKKLLNQWLKKIPLSQQKVLRRLKNNPKRQDLSRRRKSLRIPKKKLLLRKKMSPLERKLTQKCQV